MPGCCLWPPGLIAGQPRSSGGRAGAPDPLTLGWRSGSRVAWAWPAPSGPPARDAPPPAHGCTGAGGYAVPGSLRASAILARAGRHPCPPARCRRSHFPYRYFAPPEEYPVGWGSISPAQTKQPPAESRWVRVLQPGSAVVAAFRPVPSSAPAPGTQAPANHAASPRGPPRPPRG